MQLFIDSANKDTVAKYAKTGIFAGVTTTPTFFRREGITDIDAEIKRILELVPEVQIEAMGNTVEEIIKNARANTKLSKNVVSKIPMSQEGIAAVTQLSKEGIKTNVHLIFSVNQAIVAARAGATYICPLVGRLYDIGADGMQLIAEILEGLSNYPELKSKVMVSSIRSPEHVRQAFLMGAHVATIPPYVIEQMFHHPLTHTGISTFETDIHMTKSVRDVMHVGDAVPVVKDTDTMKVAVYEITRKRLGLTTVVDSQGRIIGCVTDGDARRAIQKHQNLWDLNVKECMSKEPKTISKDQKLSEALDTMRKFKIQNLVVIDEGGKPFGIIHVQDILQLKDPLQ
jgi:TalC/MipB family fructose-6-phosphate aldolase